MSAAEEEYSEREQRALARTQLPGMFLIVAGILNMLIGLLVLNIGIQLYRTTPDDFQDGFKKNAPADSLDKLKQLGWTVEQFKTVSQTSYLALGAAALVSGAFVFYGGVNMRSLNSYAIALIGSVLATIPCVSPLGCCGIGEVTGIWALVVLLNSDVRSAFP
jgi:hypothetical protein